MKKSPDGSKRVHKDAKGLWILGDNGFEYRPNGKSIFREDERVFVYPMKEFKEEKAKVTADHMIPEIWEQQKAPYSLLPSVFSPDLKSEPRKTLFEKNLEKGIAGI